MFTAIKQVQIIVSLLKQYNIRHFVISPGTRHVPLVHSVEIDPFFTCYSVVDERSAGFVALGLAESLRVPVCITCTSATATCNYLPAIQEAFERHIQLIALTADRARYQRFHGENQCINQVDMYRPFCRYSVDIPLINNEDDYWYSNRCINEVFIEVIRQKTPVQINFLEPLSIKELSTFETSEIPLTRKINLLKEKIDWQFYAKELKGKKILVICGLGNVNNSNLIDSLLLFNRKYEVVVATDYFSNIQDDSFIHTPGMDEVLNYQEFLDLQPDLVISFGSKVYSRFGVYYRNKGIPHWYIDESGHLYDPMRTLTTIFEVEPKVFFFKLASLGDGHNTFCYYKEWLKKVERIHFDTTKFTNFVAIKRSIEALPQNTIIHASVLNSMRFLNYCNIPKGCKCFGNICTDGIDGAFSTFLGQARSTNQIALLIIGDLSYLYDLNASFDSLPSNVRIVLINNKAGAEFHYNISLERISTLNVHIAASHNNLFKEVSEIAKIDYKLVRNLIELESVLKDFYNISNSAKIIEVLTDADTDGKELRKMLQDNRLPISRLKIIINKLQRFLAL